MKTFTYSTPPSSPRGSEWSLPLTKSPPGALHRSANTFSVERTTTLPSTPPKMQSECFVSDPVNDICPWDKGDPSTWPMVYLPYHKSAIGSSGTPTHIDEMLINVHYRGEAAKKLRSLFGEAIDAIDTFNITVDGWWKKTSGMTTQELGVWRKLTDEMKAQAESEDGE